MNINKIRIQTKIIKWVNPSLSQNVYVKIGNTRSKKSSPTAGVTQGSVVAPILFYIYDSNIPETPAEISQFADDFALVYMSKSGQLKQSKLAKTKYIQKHFEKTNKSKPKHQRKTNWRSENHQVFRTNHDATPKLEWTL